jgi:hypothetical protein
VKAPTGHICAEELVRGIRKLDALSVFEQNIPKDALSINFFYTI